jgi:hypothetical protein
VSLQRDEYGDLPRYQHVELPVTRRDPDDTRSLEQIGAEWSAQVEAERNDPWVTCPGCSLEWRVSELCECEAQRTGPVCLARCCVKDHPVGRPFGDAA